MHYTFFLIFFVLYSQDKPLSHWPNVVMMISGQQPELHSQEKLNCLFDKVIIKLKRIVVQSSVGFTSWLTKICFMCFRQYF